MTNEKNANAIGEIAGLLGVLAIAGVVATAVTRSSDKEYFPKTEKVQEGYVAPSKLEIECKDLDKTDGQDLPETYVKIEGTPYMLRYDGNGMPVLSLYTEQKVDLNQDGVQDLVVEQGNGRKVPLYGVKKEQNENKK